MFEIYARSHVVRRLEADPDVSTLKSYFVYLHCRGYARLTIQMYVHVVVVFMRWLRRRRQPITSINEAVVKAYARRQRSGQWLQKNRQTALGHLVRHLRHEGIIPLPATAASSVMEQIVTEYDSYLQDIRGLAPNTRRCSQRYVREFIESVVGTKPVRWQRLNPAAIRSFIARCGQCGHAGSVHAVATAIRSFLRWLQFRGHIDNDLSAAVPRLRQWRLASLPVVMTDAQLRAFLKTFNQSSPAGQRDYAMALCMIDLGLRGGEVAGLTIEDFDESTCTLHLVATKVRRGYVLPMPHRVQQAISRYIHQGRPKTGNRQLFVRHCLPVGVAINREVIRCAMRRAYRRVAGCEKWTGTHVLRRTAAHRLRCAGANMKQVADILGHRSLDATAIYTKVDFVRLAEVGLPWPGLKEVRS